ncbi:MAG: hypothetical protein IT422_12645 [Pirellulaceae bacterium]|nr:hypothetical protein [Pirellulaceae bacterium]
MDQRSIKIEIPLPRFPRSPIFRYSVKTLAFITTVIAVAVACYNLAQENERKRHTGGHLHFIASAPFGMSHGSILKNDFSDLPTLILKAKHSLARQSSDETWADLWPPKVWITRADWEQPNLETRIDIDCGGTENAPKLDAGFILEQGDRLFVNFGNRRTTNDVALTSVIQSDLAESQNNSEIPK